MNVTVETLAPCKQLLRVEIDAAAVDAAFATAIANVQRRVSLSGFRPGRAPRAMVEKSFASAIETEVKRQLIPKAYKDALDHEHLHPVTEPDIEEVQFGRGQAFQFTATVETEPTFALPDYKGLPVRHDPRVVTEDDMTKALEVLRDQRTTYTDVARPVQAGDFVVINYTGRCEDKPIHELAPTAQGLTQRAKFWVHVTPEDFLPGFTDQLIGAQAGERRTVQVQFPANFVETALAGKPAVYEVEVVQVKVQVRPPVDEAFAKAYGAEDLERLRAGVRSDLESELRYKKKRAVRDQLVAALLGRITCDLPESLVNRETRRVVYDIVRSNAERGISKEDMDQHKNQIYSVANDSAKERVKAVIVLRRIAEAENITATHEEIGRRVVQLATEYQIKPEKMLKQLHDRGAIGEVEGQIIEAKVLDFLELHASIQDAPSAALT